MWPHSSTGGRSLPFDEDAVAVLALEEERSRHAREPPRAAPRLRPSQQRRGDLEVVEALEEAPDAFLRPRGLRRGDRRVLARGDRPDRPAAPPGDEELRGAVLEERAAPRDRSWPGARPAAAAPTAGRPGRPARGT